MTGFNDDDEAAAVEWFTLRAEIPDSIDGQKRLAKLSDNHRLLRMLAVSPYDSVRYFVARNQWTAAADLQKLLQDDWKEVRLAAALNPHTPVTFDERVAACGGDEIAASLVRWGFAVKQTYGV